MFRRHPDRPVQAIERRANTEAEATLDSGHAEHVVHSRGIAPGIASFGRSTVEYFLGRVRMGTAATPDVCDPSKDRGQSFLVGRVVPVLPLKKVIGTEAAGPPIIESGTVRSMNEHDCWQRPAGTQSTPNVIDLGDAFSGIRVVDQLPFLNLGDRNIFLVKAPKPITGTEDGNQVLYGRVVMVVRDLCVQGVQIPPLIVSRHSGALYGDPSDWTIR